jgi:iron complex transport system ATP-binding protein
MTSLLEARGIAIPGRLEATDLQCGGGEMIAVIGPNGAGKTSLLRALAGIELDRGRVAVAGEEIAGTPPATRMRLLSFLPATRALVWPISARDVIALGLPVRDRERVGEMLDLLELDPLADRPVNSLSTGERSRVLFARALAARPKLLLLDEPLSNLDPYWVLATLGILREVVSEEGCAVLASLHNLEQVGAFDRVLLVDGGRIVADRRPKEMLASEELAQAFRVERKGSGWIIREKISPEAGRQSSR